MLNSCSVAVFLHRTSATHTNTCELTALQGCRPQNGNCQQAAYWKLLAVIGLARHSVLNHHYAKHHLSPETVPAFINIYTDFIYWGAVAVEESPVSASLFFLPRSLSFLRSLLSFLSLAHTSHKWLCACVCAAGGECVGPLIHFTPHWSETCDCGCGLCLFRTPWESTGVRGHMQEKHTQIFMHTYKHTMWPLNIL